MQTNEGDEKADAHRNALFQGEGDGVKDSLSHIGQREHDEDEAFNKYRKECHLPAVAIGCHYGVGHVSVEAHAGGQGKR